jgi:peroxiredoxin
MISLLTLALLASSAAAEADSTTLLKYTGVLSQVDRDGQRTPVKNFDVTCLTTPDTTRQSSVVFLVNEDGGGAVAWPERFGRRLFSSTTGIVSGPPVLLMYRHRELPNLLEVPLPLFAQSSRLADDAEWSEGDFRFAVNRRRTVAGRECWQVDVSPTGRGRGYSVDVEQSSGLIVAGTQRLTLGQGELFELTWRLEEQSPLDAAAAGRALAAADLLLELQSELGRKELAASPALPDEHLESCRTRLEPILTAAAETPFARLAAVISRDVQAQQQRAASVTELARKLVGQPAPHFTLTGFDGRTIPAEDYRGKTVVLHFWDYRDEPLEEPYGQIGYLDYLLTRYGKRGVVVYGVCIDRRLRDPAAAALARRSAQKLKSFMNLGYPIAADADGSVLKAFGDPTQFDAPLPYWVVIAPDGVVAHFRTGFYEVDRERGLKELDEAVSELAK